jgi:hypothetical protein
MIFCIVGILFSVLVDSVVDVGFDSQSGRHNDWYLLFIIRAWSVQEWEQNRLTGSQDKVSEYSFVYLCWLYWVK